MINYLFACHSIAVCRCFVYIVSPNCIAKCNWEEGVTVTGVRRLNECQLRYSQYARVLVVVQSCYNRASIICIAIAHIPEYLCNFSWGSE